MCYYRLIVIFLLTSFITGGAKAQQRLNYSFRYINQLDGLLHNDVLSIVQDAKGFIWIASANGLQRYDGFNFIYYPEMLSNPAEATVSYVNMYVDKSNNLLWLTNSVILEKMELSKNKSTVYESEELFKDSSLGLTSYRGSNNEQWISGRNAIKYYDGTANKNAHYYLTILPPNWHQSSTQATDSTGNNTWLVTGAKLYLFDKKNKAVYTENFNPGHHPLLQPASYKTIGKNLRYVMIDSRQNIWVTTWNDMFCKFDAGTKKISIYSLAAIKAKEHGNKPSSALPLINCMLEDDNHVIWAGTENVGLLRYNPEKDDFDYCIAEEKNMESIRYNYKIFSLFQDKEQNIWVGTDRGISIFNPYRQYFKSIRHEENNPLSIKKSEIISFTQTTNGDCYIGTWGEGIAVYDKHFNFKKNILFPGHPDKNKAWSLLQVDDETLWIGCQHGYIVVYNTVSGATQTLQPPEMEYSTIRCMEKDFNGNVLLGLHNGRMIKWDKQLRKFLACGDNSKDLATVINIFIDKAQHCWVSTWLGLKEFDTKKMLYINTWLPDKKDAYSISGKTCQGIEEYNDSTLLIGILHGGVNFFNKRTKIFTRLPATDGPLSNTVYAIKKDTAGYIWFTTDYGIYKFNPGNKNIIPYNMNPGTINSSLFSNKFYQLHDGQWLTFSTTEAISLSPHKSQYHDNQSKPEITGFKLFNKPMPVELLLSENKPIHLSYKENFFTIEFAALSFSNLQQTDYYYRLDGIDKDWVNSGTIRFANYTDLYPGEYVFNVKSGNSDNAATTTTFKIIIAPPFWKTAWFISTISLCILLFVFILIRWREKSIKTIAREKLKVQQLSAEQYKNKLELEQIINYFSSSLIDKIKVDDVLWDTAKNLIGRLGFVDCMIYLWNNDKTKMIQKAGFGPKGSIEEINKNHFDVLPGQGVVGYVMQTKEPVLIPDTSKDSRYRTDEMTRLSEITVPVIYNDELIGVIDSEHHEVNFFTPQHLQILNTIATLMANKIKSIESEYSLRQTQLEIYRINEQLSSARLEALRSQMNPHFIFNCINSIDALIQSNDKYHATVYLNKFAKLLRNILDSSKQNTVTLIKDLDTLKLYIELEQLRNENKFTAEINTDDLLLQDDYKVPPLIIQPFVENAILHGIRYRQGNNGRLTISVQKQGDYLQYIIEDNGVGRNTFQSPIQKEKVSYGIDMSNDRVKLFNNEEKASVQITDLFEKDKPAGTRVTVFLKIK